METTSSTFAFLRRSSIWSPKRISRRSQAKGAKAAKAMDAVDVGGVEGRATGVGGVRVEWAGVGPAEHPAVAGANVSLKILEMISVDFKLAGVVGSHIASVRDMARRRSSPTRVCTTHDMCPANIISDSGHVYA